MKQKTKYYSLEKILLLECIYNIIIGERSNGKTFSVQKKIVDDYWESRAEGAIIRRWEEDFKGRRGATMFDGLVNTGYIRKLTKGEFDRIVYYSGRWYFGKYDEKLDKVIRTEFPFCYGFALTTMEHDKSTSYPKIKNILFDEFISREGYLNDEFVSFMNVLSTIIRDRNDVKIFMLGNTVNKYCPYFKDMGLRNVMNMQQGKIDVYQYGDSGLRVAVEYCAPQKEGKASDKYFAFDNPKLAMITSGEWEIALYPHLPIKYERTDIRFTYFIEFEDELLQCEIVRKDNSTFTFIHRKTTAIKNPDKDFIYSNKYDSRPNWHRRLISPKSDAEKRICWFFQNEKVFYQDNEVGEVVRNYLLWCKNDRGIL